jgi:hypothetical protein
MLIFFDIDGTLIDDELKMPASTEEAIRQARANGHICMINTGRSLRLVEPSVTGLAEFDGLALGCGTMLTWHGETILHETFSEQKARRIIDALRRNRIDAVLEGSENNFNDHYENMFSGQFVDFIKRFAGENYGSYEDAPGHFDKFYAYVERREYMDAFRAEFENELEFVDRKKGYYEVMPKGFSKASAMEKMAQILKVPMSGTAAVGDSSNDISMIQCAQYGIAMGNATEDVKAAADYVTTAVNEDGVRNALEWLGVI